MQDSDASPTRPVVPRAWLSVSLLLNLGAAMAVVPSLTEGSVLTRDRFEIQGGEGEDIRSGWFQATPTGAELVLGDAANTARLVVDGTNAKLHFGPESAPSLSLSVTDGGSFIRLENGDRRVLLKASEQRSALEISTERATVLVQADATQARMTFVDRGLGDESERTLAGLRLVEITANEKETSIVTSADSYVLRYAVDGDSPSLEMRGPEGRAVIDVVPRPRIVLESEGERFVLGRDPKNPNVMARWDRDGRTDTWPPGRPEGSIPVPATEAK